MEKDQLDDATQTAVAQLQADWNAASGKGWDPAELCKLYCDEAVFFGGRPGHSVGVGAIRTYFDSYIGIVRSMTLQLVEQQVIPLGADVVLAQGYGEISLMLADGKRTNPRLRTTCVLVRRGDRWKILQHHFSPTPDVPPLD